MRRALAIAVLLAPACSGNLSNPHAARVIQQQFYPNGPVAQTVTFDVGAQCLERDRDLRTSLVEALERLGYLVTSPAQIACDPSARPAQIQLTAKGIAKAGRDDWSVSARTHTVTLALTLSSASRGFSSAAPTTQWSHFSFARPGRRLVKKRTSTAPRRSRCTHNSSGSAAPGGSAPSCNSGRGQLAFVARRPDILSIVMR